MKEAQQKAGSSRTAGYEITSPATGPWETSLSTRRTEVLRKGRDCFPRRICCTRISTLGTLCSTEIQWKSRFVSGSSQETCKQVGDFASSSPEQDRRVPPLRMHLLMCKRHRDYVLGSSQGPVECWSFAPNFKPN